MVYVFNLKEDDANTYGRVYGFMDDIKLSVVIPCYKAEKYISRCLDSLLNQSISDVEIICVNDGSPDHTIDILEKYSRQYGHEKIVIVDKYNQGVWKARLDGAAKAKGKYIGFIDADDYVEPDYAELMTKTALKYDADITICGFERTDMCTGKVYSKEMCRTEGSFDVYQSPEKLVSINGAVWNKVFKAEVIKNMQMIDNPPVVWEDIVFLMLLYPEVKKISYAGKSLIHYMVHEDSAISTVKIEQANAIYRALKETRQCYKTSCPRLLEVLDTIVFLHLGISLVFRLSYDKSINFKDVLKRNTVILNRQFPCWRKTKYLKLSYILRHRLENWKLWIIKMVYKVHAIIPFLTLYRFMINKLKVDIKW